VKEVWYQYPPDSGANWGDIEAISETLPLYGEIATGSPQPNVLQIKEEEKIMLNTVEEIKQLDAKNIEEAAKKVKQNRDNAEVKQASEKLTQLLDRKESLEASKKDIEKQLKEVNDLVEALGYPPKEG
jgi:seryl-tRNA synthetase